MENTGGRKNEVLTLGITKKDENSSANSQKRISTVDSVKLTTKSISNLDELPEKNTNTKKDLLSFLPPPGSKTSQSLKSTSLYSSKNNKETNQETSKSLEDTLLESDSDKDAEIDEFEDVGFFSPVEVPAQELLEKKAQSPPREVIKEDPLLIPRKYRHSNNHYPEHTFELQAPHEQNSKPNDSSYELPNQAKATLGCKSKEALIEVREISQDDMLKDRLKYKTLDVTTSASYIPPSKSSHLPSVSMKRKHNIISLAYESRLNMQTYEEIRGRSRAARKIKREQYGIVL